MSASWSASARLATSGFSSHPCPLAVRQNRQTDEDAAADRYPPDQSRDQPKTIKVAGNSDSFPARDCLSGTGVIQIAHITNLKPVSKRQIGLKMFRTNSPDNTRNLRISLFPTCQPCPPDAGRQGKGRGPESVVLFYAVSVLFSISLIRREK